MGKMENAPTIVGFEIPQLIEEKKPTASLVNSLGWWLSGRRHSRRILRWGQFSNHLSTSSVGGIWRAVLFLLT